MKALKYLSDQGYGVGSNFDTMTVAFLMKRFARKVALEYQQWLNHQALEGRTDQQLWNDFLKEYQTK